MCKINIQIQCGEHEHMSKVTDRYSLHVGDAEAPLTLTPGSPDSVTALPDVAVLGQALADFDIKASGGTEPYNFAVIGLPEGLTATSDGVDTLRINGTPVASGDFEFSVSATDVNGAVSQTRFSQRVS